MTHHIGVLKFHQFIMLNVVRVITDNWLSKYNYECPHEVKNMTQEYTDSACLSDRRT